MSSHEKSYNKPSDRRIGVLMQSCDGEIEIGRKALQSLIESIGPDELFIQIMDDASKARVGEQLADFCRELGAEAHCHRMDQPLGYRGIMIRAFMGLRILADQQPAFESVIKIDTDTLVINESFGDFVKNQCQEPDGFWGVMHTLRKRDLILLLSDLLPVGFRRKRVNGLIQRKWAFSRLRTVWWTDVGYQVLLKGKPINRIVTGGVYIIAGPLLQRFKQKGYLNRDVNKRYGFITSEEDTILSLMTRASGGKIFDVNDLCPNFANMRIPPNTSAQEILEAGYTVIHPLKANERDNRLRKEIAKTLRPELAHS